MKNKTLISCILFIASQLSAITVIKDGHWNGSSYFHYDSEGFTWPLYSGSFTQTGANTKVQSLHIGAHIFLPKVDNVGAGSVKIDMEQHILGFDYCSAYAISPFNVVIETIAARVSAVEDINFSIKLVERYTNSQPHSQTTTTPSRTILQSVTASFTESTSNENTVRVESTSGGSNILTGSIGAKSPVAQVNVSSQIGTHFSASHQAAIAQTRTLSDAVGVVFQSAITVPSVQLEVGHAYEAWAIHKVKREYVEVDLYADLDEDGIVDSEPRIVTEKHRILGQPSYDGVEIYHGPISQSTMSVYEYSD
jgi:hypothetical protein